MHRLPCVHNRWAKCCKLSKVVIATNGARLTPGGVELMYISRSNLTVFSALEQWSSNPNTLFRARHW